jgi:hypothetical protein
MMLVTFIICVVVYFAIKGVMNDLPKKPEAPKMPDEIEVKDKIDSWRN